MCYHYSLKAKQKTIEDHLGVRFAEEGETERVANGFGHPPMPVITGEFPAVAQFYVWGLIPFWLKKPQDAPKLARMCLNARIETIAEKPSFKAAATHRRCLVPATSFFEWQWQDETGREKVKHQIELADGSLMCFAGLWSIWTDPTTGADRPTFTICTTAANDLMAHIHNTKQRMPVILRTPSERNAWLDGPADPDRFTAIAQAQDLVAHVV